MSSTGPLPEASFRKVIPIFRVHDLPKSVAWYKDVLGFHGGEIDRGIVSSLARGSKAEINIYLLQADAQNPVRRAEVMLMVEPELEEHRNELGPGLAVKALWENVKDVGSVKVLGELERKEWGWYAFEIEDLDGHLLMFFQHGPDEE
ncbi:hypothetical protein FRB90_007017 [Tulasnella sp. 427]|nr:hypothetical protein FRB90_007017 [Tulasnella sp. 427]